MTAAADSLPVSTAKHPTRLAIDRVNPVIRLVSALLLSFPLLVTLDWMSAATAIILELFIWAIMDVRHLPSRTLTLAKRMIPLFIAAPLAGATMALYGKPGGEHLWEWGFVLITEQSLGYGFAISLRVILLGLAVIITMFGVDPTDMADGLAQIVHLPQRFVLGTLAGVRLITEMSWDWKSMELARRARGLGDSGAVRRFVTLAFSLLVTAIRRGSALATAMEARGFGSGKRTWARPSKLGRPDVICVIITLAIVGISLGTSFLTGNFHWIGSL